MSESLYECILVQKVGYLKYKSGILHGYKMKPHNFIFCTAISHSSSSGVMDERYQVHYGCCRWPINAEALFRRKTNPCGVRGGPGGKVSHRIL